MEEALFKNSKNVKANTWIDKITSKYWKEESTYLATVKTSFLGMK